MSEIKLTNSETMEKTLENIVKESAGVESKEATPVVETVVASTTKEEVSDKPILTDDGLKPDDVKRIKKLIKQRDEERQTVAQERQARLELQKKLEELEKRVPVPEKEFKTDKDKFEYLVKEEAKKVVEDFKKEQDETVAKQQANQKLQELRKIQTEAAREVYPDLDNLLEQANEINPPQKVMEFLETTDLPYHFVAELTKNPRHLDLLQNMTPQGIERYMTNLEARLRDSVEEKRSAPAAQESVEEVVEKPLAKPPTPVKGNASVPKKVDPSKLTTDQYFEYRKQQKLEAAKAKEAEYQKNVRKQRR